MDEKGLFIRKGSENAVRVRKTDGVVWMEFPGLRGNGRIINGFSTRLGGVSEGHLSSMNLSFSRGDSRENVMENFRRIAGAVGFSVEDLVCSDQTHTVNVRKVTGADRGKGIVRERDYTDVDGMITDEPGLVLATFYADCVPLYFVDPKRMAVGLAHSGWRGTVGKIGRATVEAMSGEYGCRPENILAAVGPSICQDCYEVSGDVIERFAEAFAQEYHKRLFFRKENGKYQLNLWEANRLILKEAGIREEHIFVSGICTCCNFRTLFSHRASHGMRGNLAAFLGISRQASQGAD